MSTLSLKTDTFRFNYIKILIIIGFTISVFLLSHIFTLQKVAETTPDFDIEAITELAEEIYDSGTITEAVKNLPIDAALIKKMTEEIERQLAKTTDYPGCEVYFLHATKNTNYPVLNYGNIIKGYEFMQIGDVWKVGITKNGESVRYSSDAFYKNLSEGIKLDRRSLQYQYVYNGTYKQCIVLEKLLIYTYSLWSGHSLLRPPGCKIYR